MYIKQDIRNFLISTCCSCVAESAFQAPGLSYRCLMSMSVNANVTSDEQCALHGFTKYSTLVRTHAKSLAECSRLVIVIACKWDSSSLQVYLIDSETILQQHT